MKRSVGVLMILALGTVAMGATAYEVLGLQEEEEKFGHSNHGSAFDSGMRTKPWVMTGIGESPFPITTDNAELQKWYDQGNALLHSFWFEEAERSFRWCHKMDPDNAMVYLGLARSGLTWFSFRRGESKDLERYREFLAEAVKRKYKVSERERLYIEAWQNSWGTRGQKAEEAMIESLEKLVSKYPDDIEAKCQLAFFSIGVYEPEETEELIQEVLAVSPQHPGAHHARIHNWDGVDSERALESCAKYGVAAPEAGHARHMPGHIYSKVGMWHEAAYSMDSAARVELKYMNDRLALPFETWNFVHNRDYLCYIQEQLGRFDDSFRGAMDIQNAPGDPSNPFGTYPSILPISRALVKFEKWEEILEGGHLMARGSSMNMLKQAAEVHAYAGLGKIEEARNTFNELAKTAQSVFGGRRRRGQESENEKEKNEGPYIKLPNGAPEIFHGAQANLLLAEGKGDFAVELLENLAKSEREFYGDPPSSPYTLTRLYGDALYKQGRFDDAIKAYEKGLKLLQNDAWCHAGLVRCYLANNNEEKAKEAYERFAMVWNGADNDAKLLNEMRALELDVEMAGESMYDPASLDSIGPSNWEPFAAPKLECLDTEGKTVNLKDYRGKNVLLVFYLSDECVHCMEQLAAIDEKYSEFEEMDTVILGVSASTPKANKESLILGPMRVKLLSDNAGNENARRYSSYDDFEDMELHATILIDRAGNVRWKQTGGEPFMNVSFLLKELGRWGK